MLLKVRIDTDLDMGVCFNFLRAGFVHISYIVYFAIIYWRLGLILDNEKKHHRDATIAVGITLGIILLAVQIGLWICYFYMYNFAFFSFTFSLQI